MEKQFEQMRQKWIERLTGNSYWKGDATVPEYMNIIFAYEAEAKEAINLLTSNSIAELFTDLDLDLSKSFEMNGYSTNAAASVDYDIAILRIHNMAKVWATQGSCYYHNSDLKSNIIYALKWMYENCYNEKLNNQAMFGNWYHWWISMQKNLAGTIIMMHDVMPSDLLAKEAATLAHFNEDPAYIYTVKGAARKYFMTSGNLADTSLASVLRGIATNNSQAVTNGMKYFEELAKVVPCGEGIYADGSFIQHTNLAYTGGYGATLLNGVEKLVYLSANSTWEIEENKLQVIYNWIWDGIRPLFADGAMFDMVSGRGIARPTSKDITTGREILGAVVLLANSASEMEKSQIRGFAKGQLSHAISYVGEEEYYREMTAASMMTSIDILENSAISPLRNKGYAKVYGGMDKAVSQNEKFSFGVSFSSLRTGRFEFGNEENKLGWHQGDGATYLYNGDQAQYADNYWPTVDAQRLAGITTDHSVWDLENWGDYVGNGDFNGGASLGQYAVVAMDFKNYAAATNKNLRALKSWFIFEDKIVALGTGISGLSNFLTAETIVENKKVMGNNALVVDNELQSLGKGKEKELSNASWAWLEGNAVNDSMGYFFPDKTRLNILHESRTGSWAEINGTVGVNAAPIQRSYISLSIPHNSITSKDTTDFEGKNYKYVLLPSKTQEEVREYSENPDIEILSNSTYVQAVRNNKNNVESYIFWGKSIKEPVRIGNIEAEMGAVIVKRDLTNCTMAIGVSDVEQMNSSLEFRIYGSYLNVVEANRSINVEIEADSVLLIVNTTEARGKTFEITLRYGND